MKLKLKGSLLLVLLAVSLIYLYNNPVDQATATTPRTANVAQLQSVGQLDLGRQTALTSQGEYCTSGSDCHMCAVEADLQLATVVDGYATYTNRATSPVVWQVWVVKEDGTYQNLCLNSDSPPCHSETSAVYLVPGQTAKLNVNWGGVTGTWSILNPDTGDVFQKIYPCTSASPKTCDDSDDGTFTDGADYKTSGEVTLVLTDNTNVKVADQCHNTYMLSERICGGTQGLLEGFTPDTHQVYTIEKDCRDYGTTYMCTEGRCANCKPHAASRCVNNQAYWYTSCDTQETAKTIPCTQLTSTCTETRTSGNATTADCINAQGSTLTAISTSATTYAVKDTSGTIIFSGPKKPTYKVSELGDHVQGPETWGAATSPVCVPDYGDAQCADNGRCVRATQPDSCGVLSTLMGNSCAKTDAEKIYAVLHDKGPNLNANIFTFLPSLIFKSVIDEAEERVYTRFGACIPQSSGFFGGIIDAIADLFDVDAGTATIILFAGVGLIVLILVMSGRRQ